VGRFWEPEPKPSTRTEERRVENKNRKTWPSVFVAFTGLRALLHTFIQVPRGEKLEIIPYCVASSGN
jgi:hypothetical protein